MSRVIRLVLLILLLPAALGMGFAYSIVNYLEIPDVKQLATYGPRSATRLYADDGAVFAELFVEKRIPISLREMPDHLRQAFIAIEDVRFYRHFGIDLRSIARAAYKNVTRRGMTEGASTITQQLARNLFLSPKKSMKRKIEEAILAVNIERHYSKDEILNMYLNLIYLGEGAYGVEAASHTYFDKKARDLTLAESATLACLTKAPSRWSPFKNLQKTRERRNLVLKKMYEARFITQNDYVTAINAGLVLAPFRTHGKKTGFFVDYAKQSLEEQVTGQDIFTNGLNVKTTVNLKMTEYGYEAIDKGLKLYAQRNPKQTNLPEVALIALEVETGDIKVLIGGKDFSSSPYNRAVQAKRQPGSAFKPVIYLAALEAGYRPDMPLLDAPITYTDPWSNTVWQPHNYKNEYHGSVTMRRALELSLNTATIRLLERVGIPKVIELAKSLHMTSRFEPNLSLALGTTEISPLELASAYATVARNGIYLPPRAITSVTTMDGQELVTQVTKREPAVSPESCEVLIDMMKGVVKKGTAAQAAKMPYFIAGKTGTTNDYRDAWFVGFSPHLLCLVWIGYDKETFLGKRESGATSALPVWIEFMSKALPLYQNDDFPRADEEPVVKPLHPPDKAREGG
jgi:penicillin-binding protein 1A